MTLNYLILCKNHGLLWRHRALRESYASRESFSSKERLQVK